MNRQIFLKRCLAAGAMLSAPFSALAKFAQMNRVDKGFKVDAGKDRFNEAITLFEGDKFYTKVSAEDTDRDLYIFESTRDKKGGPPLHYHFEQDEWWYVLEGEFLFKVGDQTFTAKKGDSVFGPRKVPHAFAKTNEGPARLLLGFQPAGKMEEYFKVISKGALARLSEQERDKFSQGYGMKIVGPALIYDKAK